MIYILLIYHGACFLSVVMLCRGGPSYCTAHHRLRVMKQSSNNGPSLATDSQPCYRQPI